MTTMEQVERGTARAVAAFPARTVSGVAIGCDGDAMAWEEVLRRYGQLVSATVRSFRLQDADAHDAIQMTWLRLAENAHRVQGSERLAGWLTTTARRECLRILRHAKGTAVPIDTMADMVVDPAQDPERSLVDVDAARMLWKLVEELSPRQCALLRALFTDSPGSYAEVAIAVGIPTGAIGPTRARALRQLRGSLGAQGL
jgi:RNA polymerase sigma factor (sigma-70 family)